MQHLPGSDLEMSDFDVAVVGLGPTGMCAAALLAGMDHRVVVFEKQPGLYGLPRAGHVDHEIVRVLQDLGVHSAFLADAFEVEDYKWYNANREMILSFPFGGSSESGYNSDYMMYQPVLEDAMFSALEARPEFATLFRGYELVTAETTGQGVTLQAKPHYNSSEAGRDAEQERRAVRVTARYLIAADGARSAVRQQLDIHQDEREFNSTWLNVDVRVKRPLRRMNPHQICDPRRPIFISPLGKRHHRFEWCVLPHESPQEFRQTARAWQLLAEQGITSEDVEIVRQHVYAFEARVAERWRDGPILLAGDAAHTMPPFMGQGACSGMRDAANLAWKLDLILEGVAPDNILDSYQAEREPHTRTWIDLSIRSGAISCTLDAAKAAERDAALLSGTVPPMPDFPTLTAGILNLSAEGKPVFPAGRIFLQRQVERNSQIGMFDDVIGRNFLLIGATSDPRVDLPATASAFLGRLGVTVTWMAREDNPHGDAFLDTTGDYRKYFEKHALAALVVRPDHYIYGGVRHLCELPSLLGKLQTAIESNGMAAAAETGRTWHQ